MQTNQVQHHLLAPFRLYSLFVLLLGVSRVVCGRPWPFVCAVGHALVVTGGETVAESRVNRFLALTR